VYEIHGNIELWQVGFSVSLLWNSQTCDPDDVRLYVMQCAFPSRCNGTRALWPPPPPASGFQFAVDPKTRLAKLQKPPAAARCATATATASDENSAADSKQQTSFWTNRPLCGSCGGAARPSILMFYDHEWVEDEQVALSAFVCLSRCFALTCELLPQPRDMFEHWLRLVQQIAKVAALIRFRCLHFTSPHFYCLEHAGL
jgi:hypothetical protein